MKPNLSVINNDVQYARPGELSDTLDAVKRLVAAGQVRISEHGYDKIAADGTYVRDILACVGKATVVEDRE